MTKYYSPSARGFFSNDVHEVIPKDAIEISDDEWRSLLDANSNGKTIDHDDQGKPFARGPSEAEISVGRRRARDSMLSETDWLVNRHRDELEAQEQTTLSDVQYKALQEWRTQLRNLTKQRDWPKVQFPTRPAGI